MRLLIIIEIAVKLNEAVINIFVTILGYLITIWIHYTLSGLSLSALNKQFSKIVVQDSPNLLLYFVNHFSTDKMFIIAKDEITESLGLN